MRCLFRTPKVKNKHKIICVIGEKNTMSVIAESKGIHSGHVNSIPIISWKGVPAMDIRCGKLQTLSTHVLMKE